MGVAQIDADPAGSGDPRDGAPNARSRQWTAAFIVNVASVCSGTATAWSAPTLPILQGEAADVGAWAGTWPEALLPSQPLSDTMGSLVAALVPLGALVGALPAGALVRVVGMRRPLLALAGLFTLGWALIMLARPGGVAMILVGRAVHGVATGAATVLVPRYSDEVAEVAIRGSLGALLDLSMCNGVLLVYVLALGMPYGLLTIVCAVVPFIFAATFFFLPESPVYLAKAGRRKEALEALAWMRPGWSRAALEVELATLAAEDVNEDADTSAPPSPQLEPEPGSPPPLYEKVEAAVTPSEDAPEEEVPAASPHPNGPSPTPTSPPPAPVRRRSPPTPTTPPPSALALSLSPSLSPSLKTPTLLLPESPDPEASSSPHKSGCCAKITRGRYSSIAAKGMFISYMLMFLQQAAAISAVIAYATQIFAEAGGALSPRVSTVLLGALQSLGGVAAALAVERAGRRLLLVGSGLVVAASLAALAFVSADAAPWLPPIALGIYIGSFEVGLGPLPWFIAAELVGPAAGGGAVAVNWATATIVTELYPGMSRQFGQRAVFGGFAVMAIVAVIFSLFLVPETRGKTRAQLKEELRAWPRRVSPRTTGVV